MDDNPPTTSNHLVAQDLIVYSRYPWEQNRGVCEDQPCDIVACVDKPQGVVTCIWKEGDQDEFSFVGDGMEELVAKYGIEKRVRNFCKRHQVSLCLFGSIGKTWSVYAVYNVTKTEWANKRNKFYFVPVAHEMGISHCDVLDADVFLSKELTDYYKSATIINGMPSKGVVVNHPKGMQLITPKES
jgi:hypothetical protein